MKIPSPIIPKEHGAWALLFVPMITGGSFGNRVSIELVFLFLSALFIFASYVPMQIILRNAFYQKQQREKLRSALLWGTAYLGTGIVLGGILLWEGYTYLIIIGTLAMMVFVGNFFLTKKQGRTIAGDSLAVLGLTLGAPCAYYIATGKFNEIALLLWFINSLYFVCAVFYVHMTIKATSLKKELFSASEKYSIGRKNLLVDTFALAIMIFLGTEGFISPLVVLAFLPLTIQSFYGTFTLSSSVQFKRLGFALLGESLLFGTFFFLLK